MHVSEYNSKKIKNIGAFAAFAVLCIHAPIDRSGEFVHALNVVLLNWAVPWYFLVSGFFLMSSLRKYSIKGILTAKFLGLIVPLFAFSLLGGIASGRIFHCSSVLDWLSLIGFNVSGVPYGNPHLWFLPSLFSFSVCAILVHYIVKRSNFFYLPLFTIGYIVLILLAKFAFCEKYVVFQFPQWFIFGCLLSKVICYRSKISRYIPHPPPVMIGSMSFIFVVACDILTWNVPYASMFNASILRVGSSILLIWVLYDYAIKCIGRLRFLRYLVPSSFFVYLSHFLYMGYVKQAWIFVIGRSALKDIVAISVVAALSYLVGTAGYYLCKKFVPSVFCIMVGGRA